MLVYLPARELGLAPNMTLWRACFGLMAGGTVLLLVAMFDNSSSVLWTFYPPLKGSPLFYVGMALVVVGSLLPLPILLDLRRRWKARRPGEMTPLVTYMSTATMIMWALAGVGALVELVVMLIPWSMGFTRTIDPIIGRTILADLRAVLDRLGPKADRVQVVFVTLDRSATLPRRCMTIWRASRRRTAAPSSGSSVIRPRSWRRRGSGA